MRFDFKTSYADDLRLFPHRQAVFWYAVLALALLLAPLVLPEYFLGQLTMVAIFATIGAGLILLSGFTGQISLGHAAFVGIGAYSEAWLQAAGVPFPLSLVGAAMAAAIAGVIVGLPALRLTGLYLAIATLAFGLIVEEVFARWESFTGGNGGRTVGAMRIGDLSLSGEAALYGASVMLAALAILATLNLLRSPTGRAFVAIRDSEISARAMGVDTARFKTLAFALSAAMAGAAGALYAHKVGYLSPEQFSPMLSIDLLVMVFVGGVTALHGAVFGAAFLVVLPQTIALLKDVLPEAIGGQPGLQPTVLGIVLIAFILLEPRGLHGLWVKVRTYLDIFPLYRKGDFRRHRRFVRSERAR